MKLKVKLDYDDYIRLSSTASLVAGYLGSFDATDTQKELSARLRRAIESAHESLEVLQR